MATNPLVVDVDIIQNPSSAQPKTTYAGDSWNGQAYLCVQSDTINISADKINGIAVGTKFGVTIGGKISFSTMPDQIMMGGGYWGLNPLLLSCIPSTTPTPVPVLVKTTPRLLTASADMQSARDGLISNSNAAV